MSGEGLYRVGVEFLHFVGDRGVLHDVGENGGGLGVEEGEGGVEGVVHVVDGVGALEVLFGWGMPVKLATSETIVNAEVFGSELELEFAPEWVVVLDKVLEVLDELGVGGEEDTFASFEEEVGRAPEKLEARVDVGELHVELGKEDVDVVSEGE